MKRSAPSVVALAISALASLASSSILPGQAHIDSQEMFGQRDVDSQLTLRSTSNSSYSKVPQSGLWTPGISPGVDYYPAQWPEEEWEGDAKRMANASLQYIRINEFDWHLLEPTEGEYNFDVLDRSIETLGQQGLKVIIGTPTATPPIWAVTDYDILPMDQNRTPRRFGSRRHYSFSSPDYRRLSKRITQKLVDRYGSNSHVAGWQLDNEFGCHGTVRTYDQNARKAFDSWLADRYDNNISRMNELQGRVFWSSQFNSFDQVDVPTQEVTESNPGLRLDFFEFSSDQVISYAKDQVDIIRKGAPHQFITTNFMGYFTDFDHFKFSREVGLDFVTWDSYPLGNTEQFDWISEEQKTKYARVGLPDGTAFNHAIYRGVAGVPFNSSRGPFGLMEMQPGPVNWAPTNPSPAAGQVRAWLHEIFAHAGDFASIFRWREVPFAEEQMHAAMFRPDNTPDVAFTEQQTVVDDDLPKMLEAGLLKKSESGKLMFAKSNSTDGASIALVLDYEAGFTLEASPQGGTWDTSTFTGVPLVLQQLWQNWYTALRRLGVDIDVVSPYQDLSAYSLVLVPTMPIITPAFNSTLAAYNGSVIFGPRSGSKVAALSIAPGLPVSNALRSRLPLRVLRVESLRPTLTDSVSFAGATYNVSRWSEWILCSRDGKDASEEPEVTYASYRAGEPASCTHKTDDGRTTRYLAFDTEPEFLRAYFGAAAGEAGVKDVLGRSVNKDTDLGDDVRLVRNQDTLYVFNYSPDTESVPDLPEGTKLVIGGVDGDDTKIATSSINVYKLIA